VKLSKALVAASVLAAGIVAAAQEPATQQSADTSADTMTVRGCLNRSRGNYVVAEDKTGMTYVLRGVGNKLDSKVNHEVQVVGTLEPGSQKTGIRSQKAGSNPADTVHGVDGTPLYVSDVNADIKSVGKCKAADAR
jgi:hypothetical protein